MRFLPSVIRVGSLSIELNSPTLLSFALICVVCFILGRLLGDRFRSLFALSSYERGVTLVLCLFTHIIGHADLKHLVGNFSCILLVGPLIEEKYGSSNVFLLLLTTAFASGIFHRFIRPDSLRICGASGVVFLLIMLSSFGGFHGSKRETLIPATSILVFLLHIVPELIRAIGSLFESRQDRDRVRTDHWSHIVGGVVGTIFGMSGLASRLSSLVSSWLGML